MKKEKISISMDSKVLGEVDREVEKGRFRNRSQAVEELLEEILREKEIDKAVILAGGGEEESPKPLEKIDGEAVIENAVERLGEAGTEEVLICAGPITDRVFDLLGDGSEHGVSIRYLKEEEKLGTAGALKLAEKYIDGPFLALSGDIYFDMDLRKIINFHQEREKMATLLITTEELEKSKDKIDMEGNTITSFKYMPEGVKTHYMNGGIYVFEPEIFDRLPEKGDLEEDVFPKLAKEGKLEGFTFSDGWKHME